MNDATSHWSGVYAKKAATEVSWYQPTPVTSLSLVERAGTSAQQPIIDVGGGASTLVDHLLQRGFLNLTVLDLTSSGLQASQRRLGPERSSGVSWVSADVCTYAPTRTFDLWHDRAVFHFLVEREQRDAYRAVLTKALTPGGHMIVATFSEDGPERCSGLPVQRYSGADLAQEFASLCDVVEQRNEAHMTPWNSVQHFTYLLLRRR